MAGKRQNIEPKTTEKKDQARMKKRKIEVGGEKKVKSHSRVLADVGAVQVELMDRINILLHHPSDGDTHRNLHLTRDLLRIVNMQAKQLNAAALDFIGVMLDVLVADDEFKGKG